MHFHPAKFAAEQKMFTVSEVKQRFFAEPVAGEKHFPADAVIDGECEHSGQFCGASGAVFLVKVNDDFRIAAGFKNMPMLFQAAAQLLAIVDFAVEYDLDAAVFVAERLMPLGQINTLLLSQESIHIQPLIGFQVDG